MSAIDTGTPICCGQNSIDTQDYSSYTPGEKNKYLIDLRRLREFEPWKNFVHNADGGRGCTSEKLFGESLLMR